MVQIYSVQIVRSSAWRFVAATLFAVAAICSSTALRAEAYAKHYFVFQADIAEFADQPVVEQELGDALEATLDIVERRLDGIGGLAYQLEYDGGDRITLILLGKNAPRIAKRVFGIRDDVKFRLVREDGDSAKPGVSEETELLPMLDGSPPLAIKRTGGIAGQHLIYAVAGIDPWTNEHVVNVSFDEVGKRLLAELSTSHVGERMAVVVGGKIITAPTFLEPITGGHLQLAGSFTAESANEVAVALRSGALPIPFKLIEERLPE